MLAPAKTLLIQVPLRKFPFLFNLQFLVFLRSYRLGKSANFFSYVCNGKKLKEFFTSTLNGLASSVRCVSSMLVVLNTKLPG